MKELELEIEREKAEFAKAQVLADERRERYAQVISQVSQSQEKLSVQLDRAMRAQCQVADYAQRAYSP